VAEPTLPTGVPKSSGVYLADYLIQSVARRVRMPISQATLDTWELLSTADESIRSYVAPLLIEVAEDYLTAVYDVAITSATSYRPPARAMKLREVQFLDESGDEQDVPRIAIEDLEIASWGFYFIGDSIEIISPESFSGWSMRVTYYLRPSRLVLAAACGVCSSVNRNTGAITLYASAPAAFGSATTVDLLRGAPPFDVLARDVAATVSGVTVTVAAASIPAEWGSAGDFVALAQETPGPQIPPDLFALLAQAVSVEVLDGNGDDQAFGRATAKLKELETAARTLLVSRVEGEPLAFAGANPIWDRSWAGSRRGW